MRKVIHNAIIIICMFFVFLFYSCTKKEYLTGPAAPTIVSTSTATPGITPTPIPTFEGPAKFYGTANYNKFSQVIQTSDNGFALIGTTYINGHDIWLVKTDSNGNEEWSKTFGESSYDDGYSIIQTSDNGYILGCKFYIYGYVMKVDANGNCIWSRTYDFSYWDSLENIYSIIPESYGYVFLGSLYDGYSTQIALLFTDSSGNCITVKTFGGPDYESPAQIIKTSDNGFLLCGYTESFGSGYSDMYIVKTNYYGNLLWERVYGTYSRDNAKSIVETTDGYIILGNTGSLYAGDMILIKTDNYGNEIKREIIDFENHVDDGYKIISSGDGNFIVLCTNSFYGGGGIFRFYLSVMKVDADLNTIWTKRYLLPENCYIYTDRVDICKTNDNSFVIAGGTGNIFESITRGFLMKIDNEGNKIW